ncbi:MAG: type II toxin-antitoxin system VapC family toxin [Anaerolineae bacterium]|nr:type II toxin-antitoxin system VapC family toxin [Anaerolineae bacterium]
MEGSPRRIVIDANLALALVVPLPYSERATALMESWRISRAELYIPALWEYEVASALRKAVSLGLLTPERAELALGHLLRLGLERVDPELGLHREALRWAARLGETVACDAQYLAVAEHVGAELWTADRRLVDQARRQGAPWVRHVLEQ